MTVVLLLSGLDAEARRVSLEGVGIIIRPISKTYRYKSDHLDTDNWNLGLIFPRYSIPGQLSGMEYATHDIRPASQDSRTTDRIDRIKADSAGDLLIAMPSDAASGNGWVRVNAGSNPDLYLDKIGRNTAASPDLNSPYWLYQRAYTTPGTWVLLPANSISTNHPPFVFGSNQELYWENPLPLGANGVVITRMPEGGGVTTLANPKLIVMPNGDYLASIKGAAGTGSTSLWRSVDKGDTWTLVEDGFAINRDSLFEHQGSIYQLGWNTSGSGETRIYRSSNNGATWTSAVFAGHGGEDAPSHMDVVNGRIWKAASANGGAGFFSAPVDANLMLESSWTLSSPGSGGANQTLANGQAFNSGNEGTLLTTKEGILVNATKDSIYRPEDGWKDGISMLQPDLNDLTKTTFDPNYAGPRLPGAGSKYTVRYDPISDRYWALTSGGDPRTDLNLYSASAAGGRIGDFQLEKAVLQGVSTSYHGFNYPFLQFDGNDLIFVSRTAWETERGQATRWHDGNVFTFHRIANFRANYGTGRVSNPGFELGMTDWITSGATPAADYTQNDPHNGQLNLVHWRATAYEVTTSQTVDAPNGTYTLSAWVRSSGGQNECYLFAKDFGGSEIQQPLPISPNEYVQITIPAIQITNGQCTIGLHSDDNGGSWATLDDVELFSLSVWTNPAGGSWGTAGNWLYDSIADGSDVAADFSTQTLTADAAVNLNGARTVGSLKFGDAGAAHNWTLATGSGGPLSLEGNKASVINIENGTTTISAVLTGSNAMIKTGPGTLNLNAVNTYTGQTIVNEGLLVLSAGNINPSTLSPNGSLTIHEGATVRVDINNSLVGSTAAIGSLPVTIHAGGTLTGSDPSVANAVTSTHIRGVLTLNGGELAAIGTAIPTIYGGWNLDNSVTVDGGTNTSTISAIGVLPRQAGGTVFDVADGGTPTGIDLLVSGTLIDGGNSSTRDSGIIKTGPGTMLLTAPVNKMYHPIVVSNGTLLVNGSIGRTSSISAFSNATVEAGGTLGGTGAIKYTTTFNAGSFTELTLGSPLTLQARLTLATNAPLPAVKVNLPDAVPMGTYTLATYDPNGSSGEFDSEPLIDSGSLAPGMKGTITTGGGLVSLVVSQIPIFPEFVQIPSVVDGPFPLGLTFGVPVSGVDLSDFTVTNAILDSIAANEDDYILNLTPVEPGAVGIDLNVGGITGPMGQAVNSGASASITFANQLLARNAAEASYIGGGMELVVDTAAPHGQYLWLPEDDYVGNFELPVKTQHRAEYSFVVPKSGQWMLRGLMRSPDNEGDSLWIEIDGNQALGTVHLWDTGPAGTTYEWDFLSDRDGADPVILNLTAGVHTVTVFGREDGNQLDRLELRSLRPLATLGGPSGVVNGDFEIAAQFSETVNGLSDTDFSVTGGSVLSVSGSGSDYTVIVKPVAATISVSLPAYSVTNGSGTGNFESNQVDVFFRSPYEQWALDHGVDGSIGAMSSDDDHDNIEQLLEFAFNLDPVAADWKIHDPAVDPPSGLPRMVVIEDSSGPVIRLQYLRRKSIPGLSYEAQFGSSLDSLAGPGSTTVVEDLTPQWPDWERVTVDDPGPAGQTRRFGRVRVNLEQP